MSTYGSRDRNPFQVPQSYSLNGKSVPSNNGNTKYYTLVDSVSGKITVKSPTVAGSIGGANADRTIGTISQDGTFKAEPGSATTSEVQYFTSAQGQKDVKNHAVITAQKAGAQNAQQLIFPNTAAPGAGQGQSTSPTTGAGGNAGAGTTDTSAQANEIQKESETFVQYTRTGKDSYGNLQYPKILSLEKQDCIKFSIVEYKAPGLDPNSPNTSKAGSRIVKLTDNKPTVGTRTILGTITLPIPGGVSDRNSADWGGNSLEAIQQAFTGISLSTILGGGQAGVQETQSQVGAANADGGTSLKQTVASKLAEAATGASNILSRQFGAVANPNLELLFNGPSLRSFTFNFRFTPREKPEAEEVRKIIRAFKQAMSVKRSASSLLLKAPHTFAISYLSKNTNHPYLNKFKECALTDCSVNYTPDGTYMTYTDSSMTAYELSLTFQELEPIFDDEYYEIDKNKDTSIGF